MLEIGNEPDFGDDDKNIDRNRAHFSLWCITSAPLMAGNNLLEMSNITLDILTNKDAIQINQDYNNYYNNSGDIITYFSKWLTSGYINSYEKQCINNNNMTELWYKPLSNNIAKSSAAIVYLNRDNTTSYNVSVDFMELPLFTSNQHNQAVQCHVLNIWTNTTSVKFSFATTLAPQSAVFLRLTNCDYGCKNC